MFWRKRNKVIVPYIKFVLVAANGTVQTFERKLTEPEDYEAIRVHANKSFLDRKTTYVKIPGNHDILSFHGQEFISMTISYMEKVHYV